MWFSSKTSGYSVAVIDVNSSSVAGAMVRVNEGEAPTLCYTVRVPFEAMSGDVEPLTLAAQRALESVGERLVREGAPALRRIVGEGSVEKVLVSLGNPWQNVVVETKSLQKPEPFPFTRSFAVDMLGANEDTPGRQVTRTVIATLLNGYLTAAPYGKSAKRVEMLVLTASLDEQVIESTEAVLRKCFHTRERKYSSFVEPSYRALQKLYPHEKDFLLITVTGESSEVISVKRGHLTDTGAIPCGARGFVSGKECIDALTGVLQEFAARHALPRTVFILAEGECGETVRQALNDASLHALWLSDVPVSSVLVQPSQFSDLVKTRGVAEGDARLAILALAAAGNT